MIFRNVIKAFARQLLALTLMLAIPVQGFAAGSMLLCGTSGLPDQHAMMEDARPGLSEMPRHHGASPVTIENTAPVHDHGDMQAQGGEGDTASHGKCSTCATCCMGAALVSVLMPSVPGAPGSVMIPFTPKSFDDYTPAGLDPPPRRLVS